ncbi:YhfC family intramembrane metalloprotease [Trinickia fusca]|uniref:YhfC family intramembrane metalloprotease n=1 Tax=Trinickia fusca TaxID=2419777 RepID=A0A494XPD8_9BURK|nr:YhfC family intramembrane metalloprotease [Trinickia fusca]RKP52517.1 YhfC family intramembrane metalloprotease [Trinickia fusca]
MLMVSPLALWGLIVATLFVALLPIALYARLRKPMALERRDTIVGIAVFAFFAMIVERAVNAYLLGINATTSAWLSHPVAFVLYGTLAAGVFEEGGRYVGMRFIAGRLATGASDRRDGVALGYGLGHGGAEAWLVGVLTQIQWIAYAILANRGELDRHLVNLPIDAVARIHLLLASLSLPMAALFALERTAALVFQVGLSALMWRGVRAGRLVIVPIAIVAHALLDVPALLFQVGRIPLWLVDGGYGLAAIAVACMLAIRWRRNWLAHRREQAQTSPTKQTM